MTNNDDFDMASKWDTKSPPTRANVYVTLQVKGRNAWKTAPAARAALYQNFLNFLVEIESKFEVSVPQTLITGATSILAEALVQNMPLLIAEALLDACGLESGIGTGTPASVDVLAGMRLCSEPSVRQYAGPTTPGFSGFLASGTLGWIVATSAVSGDPVQAFDAFMGSIASPQVTPPPALPGPLYGLLDLQLVNTGYKYHRLYYPQNVITGGSAGDLSPPKNVTLVGANTLADLRADPPYSTIFFGRDVVIPEICVWFGNSNVSLQPIYVPLGTTVKNLLERFTRWKPLSASVDTPIVQVRRYMIAPQQPFSMKGVSVAFAPPNAQFNELRAFDLPLWPGDAVSLNFPLT